MSRGVNKWIGIGNLCADPDVRYIPNGGAVCNISIACGDGYKDKNTGKMVDKTEFVRIVMFNRLAEIVGEYLRKGAKVYVEGSLRTRKWQGKDGQDRYITEIVAAEMQMLDSRGAADSSRQTAKPAPESGSPNSNGKAPSQDDFDDTIPF